MATQTTEEPALVLTPPDPVPTVAAAKADRTHRWLETQVAPGAGEPQADDATAFPAVQGSGGW